MRESTLQKHIINKLRFHGWTVIRLAKTNLSGIPDLLALKKGRAVFIEVKTPGNKPTELQTYRHEQLRAQGFEVMVVENIGMINCLTEAESR